MSDLLSLEEITQARENRIRWIRDLQSGAFNQSRGELCVNFIPDEAHVCPTCGQYDEGIEVEPEIEGYCCLGVAARFLRGTDTPDGSVLMDSELRAVGLSPVQQDLLTNLNDADLADFSIIVRVLAALPIYHPDGRIADHRGVGSSIGL